MKWRYLPCVASIGGEEVYSIRAFHADVGECSWTATDEHPSGETMQELGRDLVRMSEAMDCPLMLDLRSDPARLIPNPTRPPRRQRT